MSIRVNFSSLIPKMSVLTLSISCLTASKQMVDVTTLMAEIEEKLKSPLMKVKEGREKVGLKLSIHHFMANRWGNSGNSERLYILGL